MNQQVDTFQKLGKDRFDVALETFHVSSTGAKAMAVETADYTRKAREQ